MDIINIIGPGISPAVREYQEIKGTAENFYKSKKDFENKYNNIINFGAPTEKTKEKVRKRVKIGPYWQNP
jgi:hypothetical protein